MVEAAFWGFVGGVALLLGAAAGLSLPVTKRAIGLIMGFGAGVLISALAFELTQEAFDVGGTDAVALGLAGGALTFFAGDRIIDRRGGRHRKRSSGQQAEGNPQAIVLGAVLDGIPESVAIGVSLLGGKGVGVAVVAAVFLSNVPESLAAATGLRAAGHSTRWIMGVWLVVALVSALAAAVGYAALGGASANVIAIIQAFAAGAILTMLADTMMPEAFAEGGDLVGLVTVLGFAGAFVLSTA
ncbi:MAG: putative integral rane protein [Solirubrobacterales bacterium]|jgi:ZIP family zinc transporter|nr:putative integral rane protein [Solirubrobacterales bacterium]